MDPAPMSMEPVTPKKRKQGVNGDVEATPSKKTKSASNTPRKRLAKKPIPENEDELAPEDRMMMKMHEDGKAWKEITAAWTEMTGETPGDLPSRCRKIKAKLDRVDDGHVDYLMGAKEEVDKEIEEKIKTLKRQAWLDVAAKMHAACGKKYDQATLERTFKKLQVGKRTPAPMVKEEDPFTG